MEEVEARFALLQKELEYLQQGIRGYDAALFQVKGWCVTIATAVGGLALLDGRGRVVWLGVGAAVAFWILEAHHKTVQRIMINRDMEIERALSGRTIAAALTDGSVRVPGMAGRLGDAGMPVVTRMEYLGREFLLIAREAREPLTFGVYLFVVLALLLEGLLT